MSNRKQTKRALLTSITALAMCVVMLAGTTFAWFTDTATANVNKIQAGKLDVELQMNNGTTENPSWVNAEGQTLRWVRATAGDGTTLVDSNNIYWEPGCTYKLQEVRVVNKGNLNLKYKVAVTGLTLAKTTTTEKTDTDAEAGTTAVKTYNLNEVIEWKADGISLNTDVTLGAGQTGTEFTISGHMKESAGNDYQNLSIDGVSITVYATQATGEYDSSSSTYDSGAEYTMTNATVIGEDGKTVTLEKGHTYTVGNGTVAVGTDGSITYTGSTDESNSQTVTINTDKSTGKLTINAPNDTVYHNGEATTVEVKAVAGNSYHEMGKVDILEIQKGRVVVENGDNVTVLQVKPVAKTEDGATSGGYEVPIVAVPQGKVLETALTVAENQSVEVAVVDNTGAKIEDQSFTIKQTGTEVEKAIPTELVEVLTKSSSDGKTVKLNAAAENCVAMIGKTTYADFSAALQNVTDENTTIKLVADPGSINIGNNKTVTIDLGGQTVTNAEGSDTITVASGATLTIQGSGTVDNTSNGKAAIVNNGTVTLNGGTYERSAETGVDKNTSGGNSFYTIQNFGTMTVNAGVTVKNNGHYSSMFTNGWYDGTKNTGKTTATLNLNGGTFDGGLNTIKNDDWGNLTISGGTFKNYTQACVQNHHIATISGGTFNPQGVNAVINCGSKTCGVSDMDKHELTISGGTFNGDIVNTAGTVRFEDSGYTLNGSYVVYTAKQLSAGLKASGVKTVKLGGDITLSAIADVTHDVTIDFNGKTLKAEGSWIDSSQRAIDVNSCKLVFKDSSANPGKFVSAYGGVKLWGESAGFELNNVTIECGKSYAVQTGWNANAATAVMNSGTISGGAFSLGSYKYNGTRASVTINSGAIKGEGTSAFTVIYVGDSDVTINGGNFTTSGYPTLINVGSGVKGKLTVNDGTFTTESTSTFGKNIKDIIGSYGQGSVKGGTFNVDPGNRVADGYKATESNGIWTVAKEN